MCAYSFYLNPKVGLGSKTACSARLARRNFECSALGCINEKNRAVKRVVPESTRSVCSCVPISDFCFTFRDSRTDQIVFCATAGKPASQEVPGTLAHVDVSESLRNIR